MTIFDKIFHFARDILLAALAVIILLLYYAGAWSDSRAWIELSELVLLYLVAGAGLFLVGYHIGRIFND
jgi:hypothetical protein